MIAVFIVGGTRLHREGLAKALEETGRVRVAGTAAGAEGLLARAPEVALYVALLDVTMPEGIANVRAIVAAAPDLKIVALGAAESRREIIALAEAGVSGYVPREASLDDVLEEIESVARGELLTSPRIAAILLRQVRASAIERRAEEISSVHLTARELDLLHLIEQGLSNKEIARRLTIELGTVKNHVRAILKKLGVHSRGEAAAWARRHLGAGD